MSVTGAQWRKAACALPEAEEKSHMGHPDFRVRDKIFAGMSPDGSWGTLKMTPEAQAMLVDAKPKVFVPAAGAWGRRGWTQVALGGLDLAALPGLMLESWRLVAPKSLVQPAAAKKKVGKKKRAKK